MFTWQEIDQDWLLGGRLALPAEEIVHAFNVVAERFGRHWVEASRIHNGVVTSGVSSALHVVTLGQLLDSLGEPLNSQHLLAKVRGGLPDARAELAAVHLVCSGEPGLDLEIEPAIAVGSRNRVPDFRVRRSAESWTYVEVTSASTSKAQADVQRGLDRLIGLVDTCEGSFALEVFLKREPTPDEIEAIATEITSRHKDVGAKDTELATNLGTLYWNAGPPGIVTLDDHGEPYAPRLGATRIVVQGDVRRHITVRWPFTDERAAKFLSQEAAQLPKEAPGLIMIQTSGAVGAMKAWRSLIERRFQPSIHTRVSAVCLFGSGQWPTPDGEEWRPQTKLIVNPHARLVLPEWIVHQLRRFPSDEADL